MPVASSSRPTLSAVVAQTFIVAYKEDTSPLQTALATEGLRAEVLRPNYTAEELTYSRTIRCLLNHASAWRRASNSTGFTLIMEADFVPCAGLGHMPLPFDPIVHGESAWAFLYTAAPRLIRHFSDNTVQGHSATPVCYLVTPHIANLLGDYLREELVRHGDLAQYSLWDTQFQWHIMGKGGVCFMPFRSYGEHGGLPNAEHHRERVGVAARLRFLSRLGLGRNHYADVLHGPLAFLPAYARGSRIRFLLIRVEAKLLGWAKLLSGRIVADERSSPLRERLRLRWFAFRRLCWPF